MDSIKWVPIDGWCSFKFSWNSLNAKKGNRRDTHDTHHLALHWKVTHYMKACHSWCRWHSLQQLWCCRYSQVSKPSQQFVQISLYRLGMLFDKWLVELHYFDVLLQSKSINTWVGLTYMYDILPSAFYLLTFVHSNLLVVQNNVWPPNLIRWNSYELNAIVFNRSPSQFIVIPDLKNRLQQLRIFIIHWNK